MSAGGGYAREGNGVRWRMYKVVIYCVGIEFTSLSTLYTHRAITKRIGGLGPSGKTGLMCLGEGMTTHVVYTS